MTKHYLRPFEEGGKIDVEHQPQAEQYRWWGRDTKVEAGDRIITGGTYNLVVETVSALGAGLLGGTCKKEG